MKKKPIKKKFDWKKFWEEKKKREVSPPPTILLSLKSKQYQIEVPLLNQTRQKATPTLLE